MKFYLEISRTADHGLILSFGLFHLIQLMGKFNDIVPRTSDLDSRIAFTCIPSDGVSLVRGHFGSSFFHYICHFSRRMRSAPLPPVGRRSGTAVVPAMIHSRNIVAYFNGKIVCGHTWLLIWQLFGQKMSSLYWPSSDRSQNAAPIENDIA